MGSLLRVNASNVLTDIFPGVYHGDSYTKVNQLMSLSATAEDGRPCDRASVIMIERTTLLFWGDDGKRCVFNIFADENGKSKGLPPNHRLNAMVNAGRFTTKSFDTIGPSKNQDLKESSGSNYFVGDVYFEIPAGCPYPDLIIFGDNPINFIMQERTASNQMKKEYGEEVAGNMLNPRMKKNLPCHFSGNVGQYIKMLNKLEWVFVDYHLLANRCDDDSYKLLIRSWGYGTQRK